MYFLSLNGVLIASLGSTTSYSYMANLDKVTNTYSIQAMSCAGTSTQTNATSIPFSSQLLFGVSSCHNMSQLTTFVSLFNSWLHIYLDPPVSPVVTLSEPNTTCSNIQISWSIPNSQWHRFLLYRDNTLIADTRLSQYTDNTQLNISTVYEYSVVAVSCAGTSTAGVKSVSIGEV